MLTGRESLIRVIGKPRRFLPKRRSIISVASSSSISTSQILYQKDENVKRDSLEIRSDGGGDAAESVNCPVCGTPLPGLDNTLINSHLDDCLARGSKRKLSQVTLLQFNFSRSKVKIHRGQPVGKEDQNFPSEPKKISTCDTFYNLKDLDSSEEYDNNHQFIPLENKPFASCVENMDAKDLADNKFDSTSLHLDVERPKYVMETYLRCLFQLFIISRRYGSREELDAVNVKDPHAIKGIITSVPKGSRAAVPIQIACKNFDLSDQIYCENIQDFKSLWIDALHAVELAKTNSFGMPRYMHNLVVLIQEVLKSNPYLFTNIEMAFLESFDSLPDDSKRLFARLYTRKGFMLSIHFLSIEYAYWVFTNDGMDVLM